MNDDAVAVTVAACGTGVSGTDVSGTDVGAVKPANDQGAATVLALALIATVVMIGAVVLVGAGASAARIAAQHAADEVALAGARAARAQVAMGPGAMGQPVQNAACEAARGAAHDHSVTVTRCVAVDAVVTIHVELADRLVPAAAMAVAGPALAAPR